jgi:release factor glutamine methyltransferase
VGRLAAESIDDARLEAEVMLAYALGVDRAHLLARLDDSLHPSQIARFDGLLQRRLAREPLAYVTGVREFYGIPILCSPAALIPRPATELLVDVALEAIRKRDGRARVADVGTGSGAVAVAIAANAPRERVVAIDSSPDALRLAERNARQANVEGRVEARPGDLLAGTEMLDVIVANLPYVTEAQWHTLAPEIRKYEPREALVGGIRGTEIIERLIEQAPQHLLAGGLLAMEIGDAQANRLLERARRAFPRATRRVLKDLAGLDRVLVVQT